MKTLLLWLALLVPCLGNTLTLEFAQQGEPTIPRALVVIHNTFEDRSAFGPFFKAWADRSWARMQYCSVYSYQYSNSGLNDLKLPSAIAQELYAKIRSNNFQSGRPDPINPGRITYVGDERQPEPSLRGENLELIFVGNGYGGLIAREAALLAKAEGKKVTRVGYAGTPLDGMSVVDFILRSSQQETAPLMGLSRPLDAGSINGISSAWWHLSELFDEFKPWGTYYAPVLQDTLFVSAHGTAPTFYHPADNVLYGRGRKVVRGVEESDGFVPQPSLWGKSTGPVAFLSETNLRGINQANLTEQCAAFVTKEVIDRQVLYAYLIRRQIIEETIRGEGDIEPLGVYWDERENGQWRYAYASAKGLYEMMWGVAP